MEKDDNGQSKLCFLVNGHFFKGIFGIYQDISANKNTKKNSYKED